MIHKYVHKIVNAIKIGVGELLEEKEAQGE